MIKRFVLMVLVLVCVSFADDSEKGPLRAEDAVRRMGRGINLGNTLEPPLEGGWNNPAAEEYYFDDYKAAGFHCVRVPVRWDEHTDKKPPYHVDEKWMNRVEQVVEWGLKRDLFVIINAHHEEWIKKEYSNEKLRERFDCIWQQISERFKDKPETLLFEIINEPKGLGIPEVNELNERILKIIRKTNPARIVIFSGNEWGGYVPLMQATVPKDPYLIGTFHAYEPGRFAFDAKGEWGTDNDKAFVKAMFEKVSQWSRKTDVPVLLGEFGAVRKCDPESRKKFYAFYVQQALGHGFAFTVWDDGGDFRIYKRKDRTWNGIKDILINTPAVAPED